MLTILGAVAELENDIQGERQCDGIEHAKERGVYRGRPASIDRRQVVTLAQSGLGPAAIARSLNISRASVYRLAPGPSGSRSDVIGSKSQIADGV
jgi:DNA invertase Pin-like site-specific DNA recombinase